jgi:hypothetical protein
VAFTDAKPRGKYPWLWLVYGVLFAAGWAIAATIGGPVAWVTFLGAAFAGFWLIEGPALVNRSGGDTLTEHLQYIFGVTNLAWLAVVTWGIVSVFTLLQITDLIEVGFPRRITHFAWVAFSAWTFKHFLWSDSRLWKWVAHRRAIQRGEQHAGQE